MKISVNKTKMIATIFTILLMASIMLLTCAPAVYAAEYQPVIYLNLRPNPIGINQTLLVNIWLVPSIRVDQSYQNLMVTITKPDATTETEGPLSTEYGGTGALWFEYVPDQLGKWYFQVSMPKQTILSDNYAAAESKKVEVPVQETPITSLPGAEVTNDYWENPLNTGNREWWVLGGDWLMSDCDVAQTRFNMYSTAPNTAHILWTRPTTIGGLVGGTYNDTGYGGGFSPSVAIGGYLYYTHPYGETYCINIKTGEELWAKSGVTATLAVPELSSSTNIESKTATLYGLGSNLIKWDAFTGGVVLNKTGFLSGLYSDPYVYSVQTSGSKRFLIKWNPQPTAFSGEKTLGIANTISSLSLKNVTVYNVSYPLAGLTLISGDIGLYIADTGGMSGAVDLTTGNLLWNATLVARQPTPVAGYGKVYVPGDDSRWRAYDITTGKLVWTSEEADYPWGVFWAYNTGLADHLLIACSYGGVYAYDVDTGKIKWKYSAGNAGLETPYNTWPFFCSPTSADGKVYVINAEHSPQEPRMRGGKLHCINATTGKGIWNITFTGISYTGYSSACDGCIVADGVLVSTNEQDAVMYAFGKGKSATTVLAPQTTITQGQSIVITGSVLDQSPAQAGTPCVSADSMTTHMEYLHMQKPIDGTYHNETITGVSVSLDTVDPNGNYRHIADVTTDGYSGAFGFTWEPDVPGQYTVTATFAGDDSYGSSFATTYVSVGEAVATATPEPTVIPDYTMAIIGTAIAMILAVAIATVLILRKKA